MTKQLDVPLLFQGQRPASIGDLSAFLDNMPKHAIDNAPWPEFGYVPEVSFSIGHNSRCLFIKYYVKEAMVKTTYHQANDPVHKDSCVEFFIAFNGEAEYYNFEFNAIGTCKLNFGTNRHNRKVISEKVIRTIQYLATIQNQHSPDKKPPEENPAEEKSGVQWDLTLIIPLEAFAEHKLNTLSGQKGFVNFYKCGDELPVPHFLCWNHIKSPNPDFHLPDYFGRIHFL